MRKPETKTEVPALDRALDALELMSRAGALGYGEIVERLGVPRASAARILKRLCRRGYATKDAEGRYTLGPSLDRLRPEVTMGARLLEAGAPVLRKLRDATRQTVILLHWNGLAWECIAKEAHEESMSMQPVGEVRVDVFSYPWGIFAYLQSEKENRLLVQHPQEQLLRKREAMLGELGYIIVRSKFYTRLAVPIRTGEGKLAGALAMGAVTLDLEQLGEEEVARLIVEGGQDIETHLQRSAT